MYEFDRYTDFLGLGNGKAYGCELLLKRQGSRLSGWLSYSYARAFWKIEEINNNKLYPAYYDKPHILNLVLNYRIKKFNFSSSFVLQSGRPITIPKYTARIILRYSKRNEFRLPLYHRMDLGVTYIKSSGKHRSELHLSIYNVYNNQSQALTLFPVIPSLSYSFYLH